MAKSIPFTLEQLRKIAADYPTPFHIYDEKAIRQNAQRLNAAFSWQPGYRNYFAIKALPNPTILKLVYDEGMGFDASSMAELELATMAGAKGEDIMFTSNNTPREEFVRAIELGAVLNFDDLSHLQELLDQKIQLPELICFRYNPGKSRASSGNEIIGEPSEAKYGMTHDQLLEGYRLARENGATRFGLHTMQVSNERRIPAFLETAEMLFGLTKEIHDTLDITLEFVNLGGGFGIPYLPEDPELDIENLAAEIKSLYEKMITGKGLLDVRLYTENGRYITGPYGYLVSEVRHIKDTYKHYIGLDASMSDLMRPGMYGAYHHITVAGKDNDEANHQYDVTGSLCENNDKFAIDRPLPQVAIGDLLVLHDTGAHGHAMGFTYNGKLRHAELMLHTEGNVELIRRAETLHDYFATLTF